MTNTESPIFKKLTTLGFSEKETAVYLALLELGKRTVSPIARKAGINRTTTYDILGSLINKGLVSVSGKEPLQEFIAESPNMILNLMEKEIEKTTALKQTAESIVPELKSLHNVGNRPKIRFYEGVEGLKQVYEDTLTSTETIKAFATYDDMKDVLPGYFPKYFERRAKRGIKIQAIFPNTAGGLERAKHDKAELRETAIVPKKDFYFSPEINIYNNKVMIASWKEKLGITIESAEIAEAMKKIFELAWAEAKRLEKLSRNPHTKQI